MESLKSLMREQKLAVLASFHEDEPYTNLVGFAASDDLKYIFFITPIAPGNTLTSQHSGKHP